MTTYTEMTEKATEQILAAVQPDRRPDQVGRRHRPSKPSASCRPLPTPEGVPTALEVVTAHFAFAEKLLTAQKDFAFRLAGAATPKPKPSPKS